MTKRITQQTSRKSISKGVWRRFKNCDDYGIFKNFDDFLKWVAKSTGLGFDLILVLGEKIQYLSFPKLIYIPYVAILILFMSSQIRSFWRFSELVKEILKIQDKIQYNKKYNSQQINLF